MTDHGEADDGGEKVGIRRGETSLKARKNEDSDQV